MADVFLRCYPGRPITGLPPVCIKCGRPATVFKPNHFTWQPPWLPLLIPFGLLPYIIVLPLLRKGKTVETPLCDQHKSYWWLFPLLVNGTGLAVLVFGYTWTFALAIITTSNPLEPGIAGATCALSVLLFLGVRIAAAFLRNGRIRAREITNQYVQLTAVAPEFADAVGMEEEQRRQAFDRHVEDRRECRPLKEDDDCYRDKQGDSRDES